MTTEFLADAEVPTSMIGGMTLVRKTVTLDAKAVEAAARFSGGNLSAYVNEAVMARVRRDNLKALMEEDVRRRGPIDDESAESIWASIKAVQAQPFPVGDGE